MSRFVKLQDGSFVHADAIRRIYVERHTDPRLWKLNAQLVFGGRGGEAGPKEFQPIEERYKVFGA